MTTKTKKKTAATEKTPENFSIKNAISHANKLLNGFDNAAIQVQKMTESMKSKLEKMEEHNRDLRHTLSGISNATERTIQEAKSAKIKTVATTTSVQKAEKKAPAAKSSKAVKSAKPTTSPGEKTPVRELIQQFVVKNGSSSAKDIFHYVSSQQPASRASVYQTLKKYFHKKGEGADAIYSFQGKTNTDGNSTAVVSEDETEKFIQNQAARAPKDLTVS